ALRGSAVVLVLYAGLLGLTYFGFSRLPTGYIPAQDQGNLRISVQLPDATSLEQTKEAVEKIQDICRAEPGVAHTIAVSGQSFVISAYGSNFGQMFVVLDDFDKRRDSKLYSDEIAARLRRKITKEVPEATVAIFGPPPVSGLG